MKTTKTLETALELVSGTRAVQNGDKLINHDNIARLWSGFLTNKFRANIRLDASDVAQLMVLLKVARTQNGDFNEDDFIDICGYGAIAGELKEEIKKLGDTLGENNSAKG
mgnify:FL=1|tara:strand:- start:31 stop:360 length:330 start_codon:yes stop_codon:yes gene_type:complete